MIRALSINLSTTFGTNFGPWYQQLMFLFKIGLFLIGLGVLAVRVLIKRTGTMAERLLLLSFFFPVLVQNITPNNTLARPDVSWMFYGTQVLIIGYASTIPSWMQKKPVQIAIFAGLGMLLIPEIHTAYTRGVEIVKNENVLNHRETVMRWIGDDAVERKLETVSIRYDFLLDDPGGCAFVPYSTFSETYYIGANFDYLLLALYGLTNASKSLDGWADDPDYIVLLPEGLSRYKEELGNYEMKDVSRYVALKVLSHKSRENMESTLEIFLKTLE
jgi:hypothetical protein